VGVLAGGFGRRAPDLAAPHVRRHLPSRGRLQSLQPGSNPLRAPDWAPLGACLRPLLDLRQTLERPPAPGRDPELRPGLRRLVAARRRPPDARYPPRSLSALVRAPAHASGRPHLAGVRPLHVRAKEARRGTGGDSSDRRTGGGGRHGVAPLGEDLSAPKVFGALLVPTGAALAQSGTGGKEPGPPPR